MDPEHQARGVNHLESRGCLYDGMAEALEEGLVGFCIERLLEKARDGLAGLLACAGSRVSRSVQQDKGGRNSIEAKQWADEHTQHVYNSQEGIGLHMSPPCLFQNAVARIKGAVSETDSPSDGTVAGGIQGNQAPEAFVGRPRTALGLDTGVLVSYLVDGQGHGRRRRPGREREMRREMRRKLRRGGHGAMSSSTPGPFPKDPRPLTAVVIVQFLLARRARIRGG